MTADGAPPDGAAGIRLADWRFLLPPPAGARHRRLAVLGGPPGTAPLLRSLHVADEVIEHLPRDRSADVVVVLPPARPEPAALAAALASDGALYVEVDRATPGARRRSAARVVRQLDRRGLAATGIYATLPPQPGAPRRYVPLDRATALRWYFSRAYRPLTLLQRIAAAVVPAALDRIGALPHLAPSFAVTARPRAGATPAAPDALHARFPAPTDDEARPIVLAEGGDRVVLLPFGPRDAAPRAVLKLPRRPAFEARTRDEQRLVRAVRARLPEELRRAIPEPTSLTTAGAQLVAVERAADGRSLLASSGSWGASRRRRVDDLRLALRWLSGFHLATTTSRAAWGADERDALLEAPIAAYEARFGATDAERRLFAAARRYADTLEGEPVARAWQHGDYAVWNLTRDGDALSVLDWEGATAGPVLVDALHLVTSWYLAVRRGRGLAGELECFRRLFVARRPADPYRAAADAALADYRAAVGVGDRLQPALLLHHRLELALRRDRQRRDQGGADDARADNRPVAHVALLAAHAPALFGAPGGTGERAPVAAGGS